MASRQWYFAYGSNLDLKRYENRIKRAKEQGIKIDNYQALTENDCNKLKKTYDAKPVKLLGYKFAFNKRVGEAKKASDKSIEAMAERLVSGKKSFSNKTKVSTKETSYSNIVPHAKGVVYGVIYSCTDEDFQKLDRKEGVLIGEYERQSVTVADVETGKPIKDKVIAYVACSGRTTTHPTYPSDEYRDFIINGATQHGLPGKYIAKIEKLASPSPLQILRNADKAWEDFTND
tara:strand:+ start:3445 stop:4140 length:696 start_codon:yes stop_codon:yes gene_type:complete